MPTTRKRKVRTMRQSDLHPLELAFLFYGAFPKPCPRIPFTVFARGYGPSPAWRELWKLHRDEVLSEWRKKHTRKRCWAATVFD